jgi:hypothetical protein
MCIYMYRCVHTYIKKHIHIIHAYIHAHGNASTLELVHTVANFSIYMFAHLHLHTCTRDVQKPLQEAPDASEDVFYSAHSPQHARCVRSTHIHIHTRTPGFENIHAILGGNRTKTQTNTQETQLHHSTRLRTVPLRGLSCGTST